MPFVIWLIVGLLVGAMGTLIGAGVFGLAALPGAWFGARLTTAPLEELVCVTDRRVSRGGIDVLVRAVDS